MFINRLFIYGVAFLLFSKSIFGQEDSTKVTLDSLVDLSASKNGLAKEVDKTINLTDSIKTLGDKVKELSSEVEILEKTASEVNKLERKKRELASVKKDLEQAIKKLESKLSILKKEAAQLDSSKSTLETQLKQAETKVEEANEKLDTHKEESSKISILISKQLDSLETIGKITMNDYAKVYESKGQLYVKIKEVHIRVKEGILLEIIVNTDSGIFRNKQTVVDLLHFSERLKDKLYFENLPENLPKSGSYKNGSYIEIGDVINYTPYRSYNSVPYAEFSIDLYPNDENRSYLIRESTSINSYFEIAAFTDIKGISGEANGLAQFTADAKFITNTKNIRDISMV